MPCPLPGEKRGRERERERGRERERDVEGPDTNGVNGERKKRKDCEEEKEMFA